MSSPTHNHPKIHSTMEVGANARVVLCAAPCVCSIVSARLFIVLFCSRRCLRKRVIADKPADLLFTPANTTFDHILQPAVPNSASDQDALIGPARRWCKKCQIGTPLWALGLLKRSLPLRAAFVSVTAAKAKQAKVRANKVRLLVIACLVL